MEYEWNTNGILAIYDGILELCKRLPEGFRLWRQPEAMEKGWPRTSGHHFFHVPRFKAT